MLMAAAPLFAAKPVQGRSLSVLPPDWTLVPEQRRDATGTPRAMYGIRSATSSLPAELAARAFLQTELPLSGLSVDAQTLRTEHVAVVPGGAHVRFRQELSGVPVLDGDLVVSLNSGGQVVMLVNNTEPPPAVLDAVPALTPAEALERTRAALDAAGPPIGGEPSAVLFAWRSPENSWRLVYRVRMALETPAGDWEVLVDARTGEPLRTTDLFVHHTGASVAVHAGAYLFDPLSRARRLYGATGFTDNNDADTDSLTAARTPVVLDSLSVVDGQIRLSGPWCSVVDIESPAGPAWYGASDPAGFDVPRSNQLFEAVNAYHHVSTATRYIESLGFSIPALRSLRIDPHGFQGQDNSHYSPSGHWIGFGEGGVDDAEDADIIWHEYGHAVIFSLVPAWGGGESGALGEGISDYWAASASRTADTWLPSDYHYQWVFNWDGHNPFWAGRVLNDTRTYPFGPLPIHTAGQIVSSALMSIRGDLGRTVTDRLVLKALMYLGARATGPDFAMALIQADHDLYDGVHAHVLAYWLGTVKKFIDPAPWVLSVEEETGLPGVATLGRNYPNPFNPSTTIPFHLSTAGETRLTVFDAAGRRVEQLVNSALPAGDHTIRWDASGLASGAYFLRLDHTGHAGGTSASPVLRVLLLK
jgi:hypothetical protein